MLDAGINYDDVDTGIACYCYGDTTCGQRVFYQFGTSPLLDRFAVTGDEAVFVLFKLV